MSDTSSYPYGKNRSSLNMCWSHCVSTRSSVHNGRLRVSASASSRGVRCCRRQCTTLVIAHSLA
eukprot:12931752-Prorocentrum_lima.AAC.2